MEDIAYQLTNRNHQISSLRRILLQSRRLYTIRCSRTGKEAHDKRARNRECCEGSTKNKKRSANKECRARKIAHAYSKLINSDCK